MAHRGISRKKGLFPGDFFHRPGYRRLLLYLFMFFSAILAFFILFLVAGHLSGQKLFEWVFTDCLLWSAGFFLIDTPARWIYLPIPFLLPIVGPVLGCAGYLIFHLSRQQNYLADDPTLNAIFHPAGKMTRLTYVSLEEILEADRKIVSAGDILKWGDVPLKQALIDRLSSEGGSPRAIRALKGAWNDPDEEVRLFASTVLTRLEKGYQERIRTLEQMDEEHKSYSEIGKAYFDYAISNLVGQKLSEVLIMTGLSAYLIALRGNEFFSLEELVSIGSQAISKGNEEVETLVMDRIVTLGGRKEIKFLKWMRRYQDGEYFELQQDIRDSLSLFEKIPIPPYLDLWMSDPPDSGVHNG